MAELIAIQSTATASSDFTLTAADSVSILLKDASVGNDLAKGLVALIQVKTSGGQYLTIGSVDSSMPMKVLSGAGTYRVTKGAGQSFGVDKT
jgi:hypothetical protein